MENVWSMIVWMYDVWIMDQTSPVRSTRPQPKVASHIPIQYDRCKIWNMECSDECVYCKLCYDPFSIQFIDNGKLIYSL